MIYDEARIEARSRCPTVAIDARARHYPEEPRFPYAPFAGQAARLYAGELERIIRDYNLNDLSI